MPATFDLGTARLAPRGACQPDVGHGRQAAKGSIEDIHIGRIGALRGRYALGGRGPERLDRLHRHRGETISGGIMATAAMVRHLALLALTFEADLHLGKQVCDDLVFLLERVIDGLQILTIDALGIEQTDIKVTAQPIKQLFA
jgi:hypothetical protein